MCFLSAQNNKSDTSLPCYLEELLALSSANPQIIGISFSEDIKLANREENVEDGYCRP